MPRRGRSSCAQDLIVGRFLDRVDAAVLAGGPSRSAMGRLEATYGAMTGRGTVAWRGRRVPAGEPVPVHLGIPREAEDVPGKGDGLRADQVHCRERVCRICGRRRREGCQCSRARALRDAQNEARLAYAGTEKGGGCNWKYRVTRASVSYLSIELLGFGSSRNFNVPEVFL